MNADECVVCSKKVTKRQHALLCDNCDRWQHRLCNTDITQREYRQMVKGETTIAFICIHCKTGQDDTLSGPAESTHLNSTIQSDEPEYGMFDLSMITTTSLNRTFTLRPAEPTEPDHSSVIMTADPEDQTTSVTGPNLTASFDITHQPASDQPEIQENSIQDPDLPDTIIPDGPVTYTLVESGSQRNKVKLISSDGYEYTKKSSKGDFTYWRCAKRNKTINCPATVSQKGNTYKNNSREHIHQADKGALKKTVVRKEVKAAARQNINRPARRIVEDVMLHNIQADDHELPKVNNLRRLANQVRADLRPEEPKDLDFAIDIDYLQCEDFLIGDLHVDNERHLMFATPAQLHILKFARRWFCDGTFKITPQPFTSGQMWSIHAFIRNGDSNKQVPLLFCLMSRRKTKDYVAVLQKLKEVINEVLEVQGFVTDFEKGAWKAIRIVFPNASIKGCAFHFNQAVWRKTQELGLKTTYSKRGPEYRYIRKLMALPFLPSADIQPAFDQLSIRATSPELRQLVQYIDNTWISNPIWLPRNWSIFQHSIRTNNDVEGWHTRINSDVGRAHVSFYIIIPALRREANLVELTHRLVTEEQVLRDQRNRRKDVEGRLQQCWQDYVNGIRTSSQLLTDCAMFYGPCND